MLRLHVEDVQTWVNVLTGLLGETGNCSATEADGIAFMQLADVPIEHPSWGKHTARQLPSSHRLVFALVHASMDGQLATSVTHWPLAQRTVPALHALTKPHS